jgi:hypothetical protein
MSSSTAWFMADLPNRLRGSRLWLVITAQVETTLMEKKPVPPAAPGQHQRAFRQYYHEPITIQTEVAYLAWRAAGRNPPVPAAVPFTLHSHNLHLRLPSRSQPAHRPTLAWQQSARLTPFSSAPIPGRRIPPPRARRAGL